MITINENNQINEEYLLNQETHPHIHICSRTNIQHNAAVICNILTVKQKLLMMRLCDDNVCMFINKRKKEEGNFIRKVRDWLQIMVVHRAIYYII